MYAPFAHHGEYHLDVRPFALTSLHVLQNELEAEIAEMHPALTLLLLVWRRYRNQSAADTAHGIQC